MVMTASPWQVSETLAPLCADAELECPLLADAVEKTPIERLMYSFP
jgi:hypothetical protein